MFPVIDQKKHIYTLDRKHVQFMTPLPEITVKNLGKEVTSYLTSCYLMLWKDNQLYCVYGEGYLRIGHMYLFL